MEGQKKLPAGGFHQHLHICFNAYSVPVAVKLNFVFHL